MFGEQCRAGLCHLADAEHIDVVAKIVHLVGEHLLGAPESLDLVVPDGNVLIATDIHQCFEVVSVRDIESPLALNQFKDKTGVLAGVSTDGVFELGDRAIDIRRLPADQVGFDFVVERHVVNLC